MASGQATLGGVPLKYISLVTLTVQNSLLTILLHYSRTSPSAKPYSAPAAVLLNEILKGLISLLMALRNSFSSPAPASHPSLPSSTNHLNGSSPEKADAGLFVDEKRRGGTGVVDPNWWRTPEGWRREFVPRAVCVARAVLSRDCWKLSIPAILYVIQNNLQFVAATNLDVASFQVTYQLKILTTALCSVVMLKRRLSLIKWWALLFLAIGVALVQLANLSATDSHNSSSPSSTEPGDPVTGFIAVLAACVTSGLAGVYFELVLKGSTVDLWVRNVQLSLFSLLPALSAAFIPSGDPSKDFSALPIVEEVIGEGGKLIVVTHDPPPFVKPWLFANFGFWAWSTVLCQVVGGLVTALVIKFADNILKGFATSLSIVLSFLAGVVLFDFQLSWGFAIGCSTVLASTYMYNKPHRPELSSAGGGGAGVGTLENGFSLISGGKRRADGTSSPLPLHSSSPGMHHQHHLPSYPSSPNHLNLSTISSTSPNPSSTNIAPGFSSATHSPALSLRGRPTSSTSQLDTVVTPDVHPHSHQHNSSDPVTLASAATEAGPSADGEPHAPPGSGGGSGGGGGASARHRPHARSSPSVTEFSTVPLTMSGQGGASAIASSTGADGGQNPGHM